jgi:hypothetical protein
MWAALNLTGTVLRNMDILRNEYVKISLLAAGTLLGIPAWAPDQDVFSGLTKGLFVGGAAVLLDVPIGLAVKFIRKWLGLVEDPAREKTE